MDLGSAVAAARQAGDLDALKRLVAQGDQVEAGCSPAERSCLSRNGALGFLDAAKAKAAAGAGSGDLLPLFERGRKLATPWPLLAALGDLQLQQAIAAHDPKAYSEASYTFQAALLDAAEGQPDCGPGISLQPTAAAFEKLYLRMSGALLLAQPVKVVTSRCGVCEWLFLAEQGRLPSGVRPLPVTFASSSARPTPEGRVVINALLDCIKGAHWRRIVLSGHTDEIGSVSANQKLSLRRLEAVQQMLKDGGYDGETILQPKGKSEPFPTGATDGYSPDEVHRLNRRIELREANEQQGGCE